MSMNISTAGFYRIDVEDDAAQALGRWGVSLPALAEALPHGSGIDWHYAVTYRRPRGVKAPEAVIFENAYHAMNDVGFYTRWYSFKVFLMRDKNTGRFVVRVHGGTRDLNEYLHETFDYELGRLDPQAPYVTTCAECGEYWPCSIGRDPHSAPYPPEIVTAHRPADREPR